MTFTFERYAKDPAWAALDAEAEKVRVRIRPSRLYSWNKTVKSESPGCESWGF